PSSATEDLADMPHSGWIVGRPETDRKRASRKWWDGFPLLSLGRAMYDGSVQVNLPAHRIGTLRTTLASADRIVASHPSQMARTNTRWTLEYHLPVAAYLYIF